MTDMEGFEDLREGLMVDDELYHFGTLTLVFIHGTRDILEKAYRTSGTISTSRYGGNAWMARPHHDGSMLSPHPGGGTEEFDRRGSSVRSRKTSTRSRRCSSLRSCTR